MVVVLGVVLVVLKKDLEEELEVQKKDLEEELGVPIILSRGGSVGRALKVEQSLLYLQARLAYLQSGEIGPPPTLPEHGARGLGCDS